MVSPQTSLAVFAPTIFATNSDSMGSLTVTPGGHNREVFDHIITSLLLVERLRQLPDKEAMKKYVLGLICYAESSSFSLVGERTMRWGLVGAACLAGR